MSKKCKPVVYFNVWVCVCARYCMFTCLQVTFSRSRHVMMLLSLALIRHSVLSLSEGLPKIKSHKNLSTHTITCKFFKCLAISTTGTAVISFSLYTRNLISVGLCLLTCRQTWWASLLVWSLSPSWRSTHWCSSGLKQCSFHSSPSRWEPCLQGSSYTCVTPHIPCAAPAGLT